MRRFLQVAKVFKYCKCFTDQILVVKAFIAQYFFISKK